MHCRFHGSSATQRAAERPSQITGTFALQPELYIIATITVVSNARRIFARTNLRVMTEHSFTAPLRVCIFAQLCVTSGHYRVSCRGCPSDLSPYVVGQNDFEYSQVSPFLAKPGALALTEITGTVTSATIKRTKNISACQFNLVTHIP